MTLDPGYSKVVVPTGPEGLLYLTVDIFIRNNTLLTPSLYKTVRMSKLIVFFLSYRTYIFSFREIYQIDLVNGIFQIKFEIHRSWNDHNLQFMDLNQDQDNYLDEDSKDLIWYPWINFLNIPRKVKPLK